MRGLAVLVFLLLPALAAAAEKWTRDVPDSLKGRWAENGACQDANARILDFVDGGFRWRRGKSGRDNFGLVRGLYQYDLSGTKVLFKLNEVEEGDDPIRPHYEFHVSGATLVRQHIKEGITEVFQRCRK
jgi:hypothetical protein